VDLDKFLYNGIVDITIKPEKNVNQITLHSNGLNIGRTEISHIQYDFIQVKWGDVLSVSEDKTLTTVSFQLSKELEAGKRYQLRIEFDGEIKKQLNGFYRSSYKVGSETR